MPQAQLVQRDQIGLRQHHSRAVEVLVDGVIADRDHGRNPRREGRGQPVGRVLHGEAIALGMRAALFLSERHAGFDPQATAQILSLLEHFHLPLVMHHHFQLFHHPLLYKYLKNLHDHQQQ